MTEQTIVRAPMFIFLNGTAVAPESVSSVRKTTKKESEEVSYGVKQPHISYMIGLTDPQYQRIICHDTDYINDLEYGRLLAAIENARLSAIKQQSRREDKL